MMNFLMFREIVKLQEQVTELRQQKSVLPDSPDPLCKPMSTMDEYEEFVKQLEKEEFKKSVVRTTL